MSQSNNINIVISSDASQAINSFNSVSQVSEKFGIKLKAVASSSKDLDKYLSEANQGFNQYGSNSNRFLTSLANSLENAKMSARDLAIQQAKMTTMKFGGSPQDVARAAELAAKIYDIKNATAQATLESNKLGRAMQAVGHYGAAAIAGLSVSNVLGKIVTVTAEFQQLKASLETVDGSASQAEKSFAFIQDFAEKTPYQLKEVTEAFIKMKALGLDATEEAMRSYGDTASAMGKPLTQMIEAVADASTGEFERLKEFGIKASSEGDKVKFTFRGITTEVGKNAQEIERYLIGLGKTEFAGAMQKQMGTLGGAISNLNDRWDKAFNALGTVAEPAILAVIDALSGLAKAVESSAEYMDEAAIIAGVALTAALLTKLIPAIAAASVAFGTGTVAAGAFTASITAATSAALAFARTPIGAALIAAGAATAYFIARTDDTAEAVGELTAKASELGIALSNAEIKQRAEELVSLQAKLKDALDPNDTVVDQAKFDAYVDGLRSQIEAIKNLTNEASQNQNQSQITALQNQLAAKITERANAEAALEKAKQAEIKQARIDSYNLAKQKLDQFINDKRTALQNEQQAEQSAINNIKQLRQQLADQLQSDADRMREIQRRDMDEGAQQADIAAQAAEKLAAAQQAAYNGDGKGASKLANDAKNLAERLKDSAKAMELFKQASDLDAQANELQQYQEQLKAQAAQKQQVKISADISAAESQLELLNANIAAMTDDPKQVQIEAVDEATAAINAIQAQLDALKDKTVTVTVVEKTVQARRWGGFITDPLGNIPRFRTGGKLPGYGGGDRIHALLEAGEFIVRKEAVAKYGAGAMHAINTMRLPKFQNGGMVGGDARTGSEALDLVNINLNLGGGRIVPFTTKREQVQSIKDAFAFIERGGIV